CSSQTTRRAWHARFPNQQRPDRTRDRLRSRVRTFRCSSEVPAEPCATGVAVHAGNTRRLRSRCEADAAPVFRADLERSRAMRARCSRQSVLNGEDVIKLAIKAL